MSETNMPAAETNASGFDERNHYEFGFHVLPTVAEGEVAGIFDEIKAHITKLGEVTSEEAPERIDLAYPVVKHLEGKNRKFTSAYFGWVRFKTEAEKLPDIMEELASMNTILRHLLIKLTKYEEAHPFRFHEHRKSVKMVEVVNEEAGLVGDAHTEAEASADVSPDELNESLEKITHEEDLK
jgi:ribosomal protein S6